MAAQEVPSRIASGSGHRDLVSRQVPSIVGAKASEAQQGGHGILEKTDVCDYHHVKQNATVYGMTGNHRAENSLQMGGPDKGGDVVSTGQGVEFEQRGGAMGEEFQAEGRQRSRSDKTL